MSCAMPCKGNSMGLCMMKELKRHGYRVNPGTLYPLLHVLQCNRLYRATKKGHEALNFAKDKVREVFGGTNQGTVMRRRPTVNCRPSDTPAGNPVARDLRDHEFCSCQRRD
jgi:PadR family transcriptional regulator